MSVKEQIEKLKKLIAKSEMKINIEQQHLDNLQAKLSQQKYILENFGNDFNAKLKKTAKSFAKVSTKGLWVNEPTLQIKKRNTNKIGKETKWKKEKKKKTI